MVELRSPSAQDMLMSVWSSNVEHAAYLKSAHHVLVAQATRSDDTSRVAFCRIGDHPRFVEHDAEFAGFHAVDYHFGVGCHDELRALPRAATVRNS